MYNEIGDLVYKSSYMHSQTEMQRIFIDVTIEIELMSAEEAVSFVQLVSKMQVAHGWAHSIALFDEFKRDIIEALKCKYEKSNAKDRLYMVTHALGIDEGK